MKIDYNRIYVGDIMISDSYTTDETSFGDAKRPRNTGVIEKDGDREILVKLGSDISGTYYVPIKLVRGEHHLFRLSMVVNNYINSAWAKVIPEKDKNVIIQDVVHSVGGKYIGNVQALFKNKSGNVYFRQLKELREELKKLNYSLKSKNALKLNKEQNNVETTESCK